MDLVSVMRRSALFVTLLGLGLIAVLAAPQLTLRPGTVIAGHQKLADDCFQCHQPLAGSTNAKCITCHKPEEIGAKNTKHSLFHARVAKQHCWECHTDHVGTKASNATLPFKHNSVASPMNRQCEQCHRPPMADDLHDTFTFACRGCHEETAWKPASFDHARLFAFDLNHPATCKSCHVDRVFESFTCTGCHEHSTQNIETAHRRIGLDQVSDCTDCHQDAAAQ